MKVNYVLMYGTPYLRYKEFENFEDISKFLVHKGYVDYSIFKKLEDKEEVEMIYRDNDIHYLEKENKKLRNQLQQKENIIKEVREYIEKHTYHDRPKKLQNGIYERGILLIKSDFDIEELLEILDKESD